MMGIYLHFLKNNNQEMNCVLFLLLFFWVHCLWVLVLLSYGLLMLMVIMWLFIFYCKPHFSFTTTQPLLFRPAEQYLEISTKSGLELLLGFYLRKLSCRRGCGEGVGYHGAKYIQVIVVLACGHATIGSWCSCWCVCDRKVKKLVLQVENECTPLEKTTLRDHFNRTQHNSLTISQIFNLHSLRTCWKIINKS